MSTIIAFSAVIIAKASLEGVSNKYRKVCYIFISVCKRCVAINYKKYYNYIQNYYVLMLLTDLKFRKRVN